MIKGSDPLIMTRGSDPLITLTHPNDCKVAKKGIVLS